MRKFKYPSKSSDAEHTVTIHDEGDVTCTCRGSRSAKDGQCWHIKDVFAKELPHLDPQPKLDPQESLFDEVTGFIKPMLASANKKGDIFDFQLDDWVMEEKFDGHRLIVKVEPNQVTAWARSGNLRALPHHLDYHIKLDLPPGTYDGELIIPGGTSTDVTALHLAKKAQLMVFDILKVGELSAMGETQAERRRLLIEALSLIGHEPDSSVHLVDQRPVDQHWFAEILERGGEGAIVKRLSAKYDIGNRSKQWLKFKRVESAALTVVGFQEGSLGPQAVVMLRDDDGNETTVKTLNDAWRAKFAVDGPDYIGRKLVITFQNRTRDGGYRGPAVFDHFLENE